MRGDVGLHHVPAVRVVEIDDFDAVFAQPIQPALKAAALAHHQGTDAELAHQAAAIPAWGQRGDHDQVAVAALAAGTAKGVGFPVNAGVALLHALVSSAADQGASFGKQCGADGDAAFGQAEACFLKRYGQHRFVQSQVGHVNPLMERIRQLGGRRVRPRNRVRTCNRGYGRSRT